MGMITSISQSCGEEQIFGLLDFMNQKAKSNESCKVVIFLNKNISKMRLSSAFTIKERAFNTKRRKDKFL
jgi:hypothetical protein